MTAEREPSFFVGYKIERDRANRTLRLSMPQKIEEAINTYYPELADTRRGARASSRRRTRVSRRWSTWLMSCV